MHFLFWDSFIHYVVIVILLWSTCENIWVKDLKIYLNWFKAVNHTNSNIYWKLICWRTHFFVKKYNFLLSPKLLSSVSTKGKISPFLNNQRHFPKIYIFSNMRLIKEIKVFLCSHYNYVKIFSDMENMFTIYLLKMV